MEGLKSRDEQPAQLPYHVVTEPESTMHGTPIRRRRTLGALSPAAGLCAWALAALPPGAAPPAGAAIIEGRPDVIVCSVSDPTGVLPWDELVFYVSAYTRHGDTLYKTLTSDPVVLFVDAGGRIRGQNLADCDGRTVDALRSQGRAIDLTTRATGGREGQVPKPEKGVVPRGE